MHRAVDQRRPGVGVAFALGASALFAVNGTVSKLVLTTSLTSVELVALRSVGTALCLFAWLAVVRPASLRVTGRELRFLALYGVVGVALVQWLYFVAIARLHVGIGLLLEYLAPLLVALWVRVVRREDVRARVWGALALCLLGLALVARVGSGIQLDSLGVAAGLGAAVALAAYYLLSERGLQGRDPRSLTAWAFAFAAVLWSVAAPWWRLPLATYTRPIELPIAGLEAATWILVVWVVLLGTVAPYLLVLGAIRHLGPTRVGLLGTSEPVGAGFVAWIALGEVLGGVQLIGALVVLAGIVLAETARPGSDDATHPPPVPEGAVS